MALPVYESLLERDALHIWDGVEVVDRIPSTIAANPHNRAYLETKAEKSGHLIEDGDLEQAEAFRVVGGGLSDAA